MRKADFEFMTKLLEQKAGWFFDESQYFIVDKKISNFIREKGYASVEDLVSELEFGSAPLISQVVESLALSDTHFFRDYDVFSRFENLVLPQLRENNRSSKKMRIWSLGCSTGQETYSIAMAIKEKLIGINDWGIDIIGTDLSSAAIAKAQKGIYSTLEVQMGLNAKTIIKYFHPERDAWKVNEDIRSLVEFRRYNMLDDITATEKFEVIFCRNVLRFFTPELKRKLIGKIFSHQSSGGLLYLGRGEKVEGIEEFYDKVSGYSCLYQAKTIAEKQPLRLSPDEIRELGGDMPSFVKPTVSFDRRPLASEALDKKQ